MGERRADAYESGRAAVTIEIASIIAVWTALIVFVDPRGDFPLNDDWDFGLATFWFAESGEFRFTSLTAASIRLQVLWGALWTWMFGPSFTVLRLSTLVAAALTLITVNRMLAYARLARGPRIIATFALMVHPLFFWNAFTYMTHVPYLCVSAAAFFSFHRGLKEDRVVWMWVGATATGGAFYVRQWGIAYAVAALLVLALFQGRISSRWRTLALPPLLSVVAFVILYKVTGGLAGSPTEFVNHYKMWFEESFGVPEAATVAYRYTLFSFQIEGLFFLPLLLPAASLLVSDRRSVAVLALSIAVFLAGAIQLLRLGYAMPYWALPYCCDIFNGNIFINFGLGPPTLPDVWVEGFDYPFALGNHPRLVLTLLATLLGAALLALLVRVGWQSFERAAEVNVAQILPLAHIGVAFVFLFVSQAFFDRYSLDVLWPAALVLPRMGRWNGARTTAAVAALVAIGVFSALATQEYLRWNRSRWQAVNELLASGVQPEQIDAGQEVIKFLRPHRVADRRFRVTGEYAVAFRPLPGYHVVRRYPFRSFLGFRRGEIVSMRRAGPLT